MASLDESTHDRVAVTSLVRPKAFDPRLRSEVAWASVLALLLAVSLGTGAPPSEFAPRSSAWWALEPLMLPSLGAGVLLAVMAFALNALPSGHRTGAYLCLVAPLATAVAMDTGGPA